MQGWLKLYRQLAENPIWLIKPFSEGQAWVDLLMITTFDSGFIKTKNGTIIKLNSGQCGFSQLTLSERWGWSRGKVNRYLKLLESERMIQQKIVANTTIINILNYDNFQNDTINNTINDTINGQQTIQQTDTIKNDNNDNNENNNIYGLKIKKFQKPTLEEIKTYCLERNNNVDANKFFDFYESNGWKVGKNPMKDWKASVRTWERNNFGKENKQEEFNYDSMPYNAFR